MLNGGAGTDTLNLTTTGATRLVQSTDIENINVNASGTTSVNLSAASGYDVLASRYSSNNVTFTNVREATALEANGVTGSAQVNAQFADALVSGTADSVSVNVKDGSTVNFGLGNAAGTNEFETINLSSSGSANTVTFNKASDGTTALAGLNTLNITGSADLTVNLDMTTAAGVSVNAKDFTGALTANVTAATVTSVTGGAGNDTIDLTGADVTTGVAAKTIDGGAGTNTLVIDADLTSLTSSHATDKHSFTNIQNVLIKQNAGAGTTDADLDASLVTGLQTVTVTVTDTDNGTNAETSLITNMAAGQRVIVKDSGRAASAVNDANDGVIVSAALKDASGTADEMLLTVTDSTAAITVADDGSSNGVETVKLTSSGTSTTGNIVSVLTAAKATKLVIDGSQKIEIGATAAGAAAGAINLAASSSTVKQEIDAGALTGNLTIGSTASAGFEAEAVKLTLGSGTNKVYFGTTLGDTDEIIGTAGTNDTVVTATVASAGTIKPTLNGVETLEIATASGTTNTRVFSLENATGLNTVKISAATDNAGGNVDLSNINGQTIEVALKDSTTDTNYTGKVLVAGLKTGVTGATVKLSGDIAFAGTIQTAGTLTVNDTTKTTAGAYIDQTVDLDGTSSTAKLTKVVATGGGVKTGTTLSTLTVDTNDGNVALTEIDATGYNGNLTLTGLTGTELGEAAAIKTAQGSTTVTVAAAKLAADQLVFTDTGTSGTDTIAATGVGTTGTGDVRVKSTGFEVLDLALAQASEVDTTVDLRDATGVSKVVLSVADTGNDSAAAFDKDINLNNLADGATVELKGVDAHGTDFVEGSGNVMSLSATQSGAQSVSFVAAGTGALKIDANATGEGVVLGSTYKTATFKQGASNNLVVEEISASGLTTLNLGGQDKNSSGTAYTGNITVNAAVAAALTTVNIDATNGNVTFADVASTLTKLATVTIAGAAGKTVTFGDDTAVTVAHLATIDGSGAAANITIGTGIAYKNGATITTGTGDDSIAMNLNLQANAVIDAGGNPASTPTGDTLVLMGAGLGTSSIDLSSTTDQVTQINGGANAAVQKGFENLNASGMTGSGGVLVTAKETGSVIAGTANADVITLGAGVDKVVFAATSAADTIFSFANSTAEKADLIQFSVAGFGNKLSSAASGATADAATASTVVQANKMTNGENMAAGDNVIVLSVGNLADASAAETAMEAGGTNIVKTAAAGSSAVAAGDKFLVVYYTGADTHVAIYTANTTAANTALDAGGSLADIAVLSGVNLVGLTDAQIAGSFDFI